MTLESLSISGAWTHSAPVFRDDRGSFREWFQQRSLQEAGVSFTPVQANLSQSVRGVVRGIHYSLAPEGQAKWVTCAAGSIVDVIVDIRVGSPTFGQVEMVPLTAGDGNSVFLSSGLGHAFVSLQDDTVVSYLLSSPYAPAMEFGIHPMDSELNIQWPLKQVLLSPKDQQAPALRDVAVDRLPKF